MNAFLHLRTNWPVHVINSKLEPIDQLFCDSLPSPPASPRSTSVLTRAAEVWAAGLYWFQCVHVCVRAVVCCEIPLPKKVLIDPPSANTLWQCPGETQQSTDSAACNWIPPPQTEPPHSSSSQGQEGRELTTLKEHFPCTCLSYVGCELLLPQVFSSQTSRAMSSQPAEESRGRSPICSVVFHGVCNGYCSGLWKQLSNCGQGDCVLVGMPAGDKWMEGKFKGIVWHFEKYVAYFLNLFFANSVENIDNTFIILTVDMTLQPAVG